MASYEKAAVIAALKNVAADYRAKADADAEWGRRSAERNLAAIDTERLCDDLMKVRDAIRRGRKPPVPIGIYGGAGSLTDRLNKWALAIIESKHEIKPDYTRVKHVERIITMIEGVVGDTVPVTDLRNFGALELLRIP